MTFGLSAATLGTIASVAGPAIGGLLGGHASSGAQQGGTKTLNEDPWLPAQDWMKQNIANGQGYQAAYQASPFNGQQQAAYSNLASGGDYLNRLVPSLLSQMSQPTGFDRNNPTARPAAYSFNAPSNFLTAAHNYGGLMQQNVPGTPQPQAQQQTPGMPFLLQADAPFSQQSQVYTPPARSNPVVSPFTQAAGNSPLPQNLPQGISQADIDAANQMDYRRMHGIGEFAGNSSN